MFIELTNNKEKNKQLINLDLVESFTALSDTTLIHFNNGTTLTVEENYKSIVEYLREVVGLVVGSKYY